MTNFALEPPLRMGQLGRPNVSAMRELSVWNQKKNTRQLTTMEQSWNGKYAMIQKRAREPKK